MIATLTGLVASAKPECLIVDVAGVGYKVFALPRTITRCAGLAAPIKLFTHHHVREDAQSLFGFETEEELALFDLLLTVSGVGPKVAMNIMAAAPAAELRAAIASENVTTLTKVAGVGKKTAERVVVELKNKLSEERSNLVITTTGNGTDAIDALVQLGFAAHEARGVLASLDSSITEPAAQVRAALKLLGKA